MMEACDKHSGQDWRCTDHAYNLWAILYFGRSLKLVRDMNVGDECWVEVGASGGPEARKSVGWGWLDKQLLVWSGGGPATALVSIFPQAGQESIGNRGGLRANVWRKDEILGRDGDRQQVGSRPLKGPIGKP